MFRTWNFAEDSIQSIGKRVENRKIETKSMNSFIDELAEHEEIIVTFETNFFFSHKVLQREFEYHNLLSIELTHFSLVLRFI